MTTDDAQTKMIIPPVEVPETPPLLDEARIHENANKYEPRGDGFAYKGMQRGRLTGAFLGLGLGALFGTICLGLLSIPALGVLGLGAIASPLILIPAMAAVGAIILSEGFGIAGTAAGARSGSLAHKFAKRIVKNPLYPEGNEPNTEGRYGNHFEVPPDRDHGVWFHPKTAAIGATVAGGIGALLGISLKAAAVEGAGSLFAGHGLAVGATALLAKFGLTFAVPAAIPIVAAIAIPAVVYGMTYGVNRSIFRSIFNWTDGLTKGELKGRSTVERFKPPQTPEEKIQYEVDLKRQEVSAEMEPKLFKQIFWHSIGGRFGGFAGGPVAGIAIGAIAGIAIAGLLVGLFSAPLASLAIIMTCTGIGAAKGIETFASTGTEAGAEAMSKAVDEEFDRQQTRREKGLAPDVSPQPAKDKKFFNWKAGAVCAVAGAGIALLCAAPFIGFMTEALALGKAFEVAALTKTAILTCCGGLGAFTGATYGLKARVMQGVGDFAQNLYDGKMLGTKGTEHAYHAHEQEVTFALQKENAVTAQDMLAMNNAARERAAQNFTQRIQAPAPTAMNMGVR